MEQFLPAPPVPPVAAPPAVPPAAPPAAPPPLVPAQPTGDVLPAGTVLPADAPAPALPSFRIGNLTLTPTPVPAYDQTRTSSRQLSGRPAATALLLFGVVAVALALFALPAMHARANAQHAAYAGGVTTSGQVVAVYETVRHSYTHHQDGTTTDSPTTTYAADIAFTENGESQRFVQPALSGQPYVGEAVTVSYLPGTATQPRWVQHQGPGSMRVGQILVGAFGLVFVGLGAVTWRRSG